MRSEMARCGQLFKQDGLQCRPEFGRLAPPTPRLSASLTSTALFAAMLFAGSTGAASVAHAQADAAADSNDGDLEVASEEVAKEDDNEKGTGLTLQQRIKAVSRPVFTKKGRFEATPFHGFSGNDAFFQRLQVGVRASYHIFEWLSAEAGGAVNYFSVPLQSVRLIAADPLEVQDPAPLLGYADVGVNFAPLYAKAALVSEWVVHFDAFATAGVGAMFDLAPGDLPVHPALSLGVGARAFITEWLVFRVDLKNFTFPSKVGTDDFSISNGLFLNVGVGFYFPFTSSDDEDVVKVVG